jgi:hypothetical protein
MKTLAGLLVLAGALGACSVDGDGDGDEAPLLDVPLELHRDLDLLFVVDDSGSMRQEQEALAAALPSFIEQLAGGGDLPSLHIGVVSSNLGTAPEVGGGPPCEGDGDAGHLQVAAACPALDDQERFIRDEIAAGGERVTNYAGELADQFACMVQLGTAGCGFEQHLEAMRRALDNDAENAGFLRPGANLAVVILADEDDCSASDRGVFTADVDDREAPLGELSSFRCFEFGITCDEDATGERELGPRSGCVPDEGSAYFEQVSTYVDGLRQVKGEAPIVVATISGPPTPVEVIIAEDVDTLFLAPSCVVCPDGAAGGCSLSPTEEGGALVAAFPAIRMRAFADAFGERGRNETICSYDAETQTVDFSLGGIADLVRTEAVTLCAPAAADAETCRAFDVAGDTATEVPWCGGDEPTCARLIDAPGCEDGRALVIDRTGAVPTGDVALRCPEPPA